MINLKEHNIELVISSDLYKAGVTEDGEDYIAERYHVSFWVGEAENRFEYIHPQGFAGCVVKEVEEIDFETGEVEGAGIAFFDIRDKAQAKCEAFMKKIVAKGVIDPSLWLAYRWGNVNPEQGDEAHFA